MKKLRNIILILILSMFFIFLSRAEVQGIYTISLVDPIPASDKYTSYFGPRVPPPAAGANPFHHGVDIGAPTGTPIVAAKQGVVYKIKNQPDGCGLNVLITHGGAYMTRYSHLSAVNVSEGQYVSAGQQIGLCGSTGISTGPHLDFRVYITPNYAVHDKVAGDHLDPLSGDYLDPKTMSQERFHDVATINYDGKEDDFGVTLDYTSPIGTDPDDVAGSTNTSAGGTTTPQVDPSQQVDKSAYNEFRHGKKDEDTVKDDPPDLLLTETVEEKSIDEVIEEAKDFIKPVTQGLIVGIKGENLLKTSKTLSNILMIVAIGASLIIGAMIGIQTMIASAEEKAEAKKALMPYLIGAFISFGAFGIWSLAVTIIESIS